MQRTFLGLVALAMSTALIALAPPADAAVRYGVTVAPSATRAEVGQTVVLKGRVGPKARGEKVRVQRLAGGHWTTVAKARLNRHSRYSAPVRVATPGSNLYRVVKPKSHRHPKGISGTVTVTGWHWRPLASLRTEYVTGSPTFLSGATYHDLHFGPSILLPSFTGISYFTEEGCDAFDAHIWLTADSPFAARTVTLGGHVIGDTANSGTTAQATAWVGGGTEPAHLYRGPGLIARLDRLSIAGTVDGTTIWGGARLHCRF